MNKLRITPILAGMIGGIIVLLVYESNISAQVVDDLNRSSMHPCEFAAHESFDLMDEMNMIYEQLQIEGMFGDREYYEGTFNEIWEKQISVQEKMDELKCHEKLDEWVTEELADRYDQSMNKARNSGMLDNLPSHLNPFRMYLHQAELEQGTGSINTCPVMTSGMTEEEIARYYEILEERPECKEWASKK